MIDRLISGIFSVFGLALKWIWSQLTYRTNQRISIVFSLYVINILLFARIYDHVYHSAADKFPHPDYVFGSEIVRSHNRDVRTAMEQRLLPLRSYISIFSKIQDSVRGMSKVLPKYYQGNFYDVVEFSEGNNHCEISLGPGFVQPGDGRAVKIMSVVLYEGERRVYGREVRLLGPLYGDKPSSEAIQWEKRVGSGSDPTIYLDVLDVILKELTSQVSTLESTLQQTLSDKPYDWSYWDFAYFSTMTQTTVGYGDIVPSSGLVRTLVSIQVLVGLALAGFGLSFIIRPRGGG
jgi:hypothetical protein